MKKLGIAMCSVAAMLTGQPQSSCAQGSVAEATSGDLGRIAESLTGLTPIQREVLMNKGTERPFHNEYWDNKDEGIYVDVITGEPLFSSIDKYDSGTGWPSFTRPIKKEGVSAHTDNDGGMKRVEIRSASSDTHLGHVFNDGPKETGGLRYCMNSAALRFIPKANMAHEGYGEYLSIFDGKGD